MKLVKFKHGYEVYRENASGIDGLYFIKSGDFEVSQVIDQEMIDVDHKLAKRALSRNLSNT